MSKVLMRMDDGAIFKENEDGSFSLRDSQMHDPYRWPKERLLEMGFEEFEENFETDVLSSSLAAEFHQQLLENGRERKEH
jgi:hypothetical protein